MKHDIFHLKPGTMAALALSAAVAAAIPAVIFGDDSLSFVAGSLAESDPADYGPGTFKGDFGYNGFSEVVYYKADGPELEYGIDGTDKLEPQEIPDPGYRFIGCFDMDGDHRGDMVACRKFKVDNTEYIEVGYGKSGHLDEWQVLGVLGNPDNVKWEMYCGNFTGNKNRNSILWYAPALGAMGYWADGKGVDSWVTIPGSYGQSNWKVLGIGNFTDAKNPRDSVLVRYNQFTIGYVSADGTFTVLGVLDDGKWIIVAVDDFTHDGIDDVVLFHPGLRQLGLWDSGLSTKWRYLGTVEEGAVIEGSGEYDCDGNEDLLVRQADGTMGYFQRGLPAKFKSFGYKKDSSWTVIP